MNRYGMPEKTANIQNKIAAGWHSIYAPVSDYREKTQPALNRQCLVTISYEALEGMEEFGLSSLARKDKNIPHISGRMNEDGKFAITSWQGKDLVESAILASKQSKILVFLTCQSHPLHHGFIEHRKSSGLEVIRPDGQSIIVEEEQLPDRATENALKWYKAALSGIQNRKEDQDHPAWIIGKALGSTGVYSSKDGEEEAAARISKYSNPAYTKMGILGMAVFANKCLQEMVILGREDGLMIPTVKNKNNLVSYDFTKKELVQIKKMKDTAMFSSGGCLNNIDYAVQATEVEVNDSVNSEMMTMYNAIRMKKEVDVSQLLHRTELNNGYFASQMHDRAGFEMKAAAERDRKTDSPVFCFAYDANTDRSYAYPRQQPMKLGEIANKFDIVDVSNKDIGKWRNANETVKARPFLKKETSDFINELNRVKIVKKDKEMAR